MTKRHWLHFGITISLLLLAVYFSNRDKDTALLRRYAEDVSGYLTEQKNLADTWIAEEQNFLRTAALPDSPEKARNLIKGKLPELEAMDFTILLHRGDTLVFWSNNKVIPKPDEWHLIRQAIPPKWLQLPLGDFYVEQQAFDNLTLTLLVPIRYALAADAYRLQQIFPANSRIPELVTLSAKPTAFPVRVSGQDMCWLAGPEKLPNARMQWVAFGLTMLFLFAYFTLVDRWAMWAANRYKPVAGSAALVAGLLLVLGANYLFDFTGRFDALSIFAQKFESPSLGSSLGEWMLHIIVLLWLMVFFHREFPVSDWNSIALPMRMMFGIFNNLAMMISILMGIFLFRGLIFDSGISFDFDNFLNFDWFSFLAILGIILLLAGLFLFSHRMMQSVFRLRLNRRQRSLAYVAASVLVLPFCLFFNDMLKVSPTYVMAFSLVYVVAFDYFIEHEQPGFGWIMSWLFVFSLFSALLLYKYNDSKDGLNRRDCAYALAQERDSLIAEPRLEYLQAELRHDRTLDSLMPPRFFTTPSVALERRIAQFLFRENYLFQHFRLKVFAFAPDKGVVLSDQVRDYNSVVTNDFDKGKPVGGNPDLRWRDDSLGNYHYIMRRPALGQGNPEAPMELYVFFYHEYPKSNKNYTQGYQNRPYKNLKLLQRYDFAIFKRGTAIAQHGAINAALYNPALFPGPDSLKDLVSEDLGRTDFVYTNKNGTTVVVGRDVGAGFKRLYLFASLFTLLSIFMIVLGLVNSWVRILPDYYKFYITTKGSLSKRIQVWTVALIVGTFGVIGVMTYRHSIKAAETSERLRLEYRSGSMLAHLANKALDMQPTYENMGQRLPALMTTAAESFATDAHFYDRTGEMVATTQDSHQKAGQLSCKMNPFAKHLLETQSVRETSTEEQSGSFRYTVKYAALYNRSNDLLGFVGIPYMMSETNITSDLSDFIGRLAVLYVFLLVITGSVAFWVSGTIIKPIQLIAEEIKKLRLEDRNKQLEYHGDGQDELSTLIDEYNRMVDKLEDSKGKLIRFEREGAWKEMARQVAHDIKNPLTTMKLSMQQLERVAGGDMEQARDYLKKAIGRLIEQIDSLAHIASEFSMFAKLDITQKYDVLLNDVVENVFELFAETEGIRFELNNAPEPLHIQGDKNHLMRVFNNLIINATQAIPSDRDGLIRVAVYENNGYAVVRVTDNAGGIPPEVAKRVFEPNFTTKTSGSGLGLAICKKIVDLHDGIIRFETRENDGTDFFVELPRVEA